MVNINIVRPSSNAPDSKALYDKVHELNASGDADDDDDEMLNTLLSGMFNIMARLESLTEDGA